MTTPANTHTVARVDRSAAGAIRIVCLCGKRTPAHTRLRDANNVHRAHEAERAEAA